MTTVPEEPIAAPLDKNARFLSTEHLGKNLRARSVRGGAAALLGQGGTFVLNAAGTAVLARILTPRDFGLLAMVATFTRLIEQLKDMGLASATVQRKELSQEQVSYLFWLNVAVGLGATVCTVAAAPLLSWFYGEPGLTEVTIALAGGFAAAGLGVQHQALLQRQMRLRSMAVIKVAAALVGTLAGIGAAFWGAGYWSLVLMNLVTALAQSIGVWWSCAWRPSAVFRRAPGVSELLTFGWHITGSRMLTFITRNLDNILIGKVWGDAALGFYAKAYQLLMLPVQQLINPLTDVVVPALSRLQDDQAAYIRYYQRSLRTLTTVTMPTVAFSFIAADEVIRILLGERWAASIPIFKWLAPAAFVGTFNPIAWAWISLNQTDRLLKWNLISMPFYVAGFAIGVPFGVEGVAAAFSITQLSLRYFSISYCYKHNFLNMGILIAATWQATVASLGALAIVLGGLYLLDPQLTLVFSLLLKGTAYLACYLGIWWCLPGGPAALRETLLLVRDLRGQGPRTQK